MSLLLALCLPAAATDLAIRGEALHPVSGPMIPDGVVLIADGNITAIGPASQVAIPDGVPVITGAVVTPGLVDGLSTAGLTGIHNIEGDQDHRETSAPVQPRLRALDGFDPWEPLIDWVQQHGTTTLQVGPSPGAAVAGRTAVVTSEADTAGAQVLVADGMMVFSLGDAPKQMFAGDGARSRMGTAALIRQALTEAQEYAARRRLSLGDRAEVDLGLQALAEVVSGKRRALFHAHRADDLLTALRITEEFGLDAVLAGGAEAYLVRNQIAAADVPVLVGPMMLRSWGPSERTNASFRNAALLVDAGVTVGVMTGFEGYVPKVRVPLFEAAIAAGHGLGRDRALHAATLGSATILGIDDRAGSLQVGKRADVAVFDGDPFEYTTHVCSVIVGGAIVSETCR